MVLVMLQAEAILRVDRYTEVEPRSKGLSVIDGACVAEGVRQAWQRGSWRPEFAEHGHHLEITALLGIAHWGGVVRVADRCVGAGFEQAARHAAVASLHSEKKGGLSVSVLEVERRLALDQKGGHVFCVEERGRLQKGERILSGNGDLLIQAEVTGLED